MATGPGPVERNTLWDEVAEQDHPAVRNTDLDTSHEAWAMVELWRAPCGYGAGPPADAGPGHLR